MNKKILKSHNLLLLRDLYRKNLVEIGKQRYIKKSITKKFITRVGYEPNFEFPKTYNEKIQWLKLHWRDDKVTMCIDKVEVREFVKEKGFEYILNDVIGVYSDPLDIPFENLPNKFVLKANHGSGWNIICNDKEILNKNESIKKMQRWLKDNFYYHGYEWGYKNITPKIICEKYIETENGDSLKDYKVFCFHGEPKMIYVASDREEGQTKFDFYTCDWQKIPVRNYYPNSLENIEKPKQLKDILEISRILSDTFPHVRVDFFIENDKIYFSELTFGHFSGMRPFEPIKYDYELGGYLELDKIDERNLIDL